MSNVLRLVRDEEVDNVYYLEFFPMEVENLNMELLKEAKDVLSDFLFSDNKLRFLVIRKVIPGVFSYGGDLGLFVDCLERGDQNLLREYGDLCIKLSSLVQRAKDFNVVTISLVEGDAFGGGFEIALATDYCIATENARFSFPEMKYGFFPGMGGYELLSRLVSPKYAERVIIESPILLANEVYEKGIINYVVKDRDEALKIVYGLVSVGSGILGLNRVKMGALKPLTFSYMKVSLEHWISSILRIGKGDINKMKRVVKFQKKKRDRG